MRISDWSSDVCSSDLAVVGYCWGGSVAWLAACRHNLAAAVCYYGGNIHECRNETPSCPVMFHFGEEDASIPMEQVKEIGAAHPKQELFTYPAGHGFNCEMRGSYHADSAAVARSEEHTSELQSLMRTSYAV